MRYVRQIRTILLLLIFIGSAWIAHTAGADSPAKLNAINLIIGYAPGGGTDATGRLIATFLTKYLPGNPRITVVNMPGADGLIAANYFAQQVAPDGLTIMMGSGTQIDPMHYRRPQARYNPTKFGVIGGIGRGGTVLIIRKSALPRISAKDRPPVMMGSLGSMPRSGMLSAAWGKQFLGWNIKWVIGYPGTNELFLALDRGEIDMTATADLFQIQRRLQSGHYALLVQTGYLRNGEFVRQDEFKNVPMVAELLKGKLHTPFMQQAFDYWAALSDADKWLATPPNTPAGILEMYRMAFQKVLHDPLFVQGGERVSESFEAESAADMEALFSRLDRTPPEAIAYLSGMLKQQGLTNE